MTMKVRKAVFPAAGLVTRFLPATKAQPKEMLPIVDKPIIQYGVEEALAAGCDQIIIVTGRGKQAIEDHFDVSYELEKMLEERKKTDLLQIVRQISDMIHVAYVRQKEALGHGHAVLMARELGGNEPFAVLLAEGGELQLTDGMRLLLKKEKIYAYVYEGRRHDTGDKLGFLKATVEFALKREGLGDEFRRYLKELEF